MIVYCLLAATLILAVLALLLGIRSFTRYQTVAWSQLSLAVAMAVFAVLYGGWVFISVYLRYIFIAGFTLSLLWVAIRASRGRRTTPVGPARWCSIILAVVFAGLCVLYYTGTLSRTYRTASLSLPFSTGRYYVFQGGRGLPTNVFHYSIRGTILAMDLVKLNTFGNRSSAIFSHTLSDYCIFADTVYSPCAGTVLNVADINPDNIPPSRRRGPANTNHVLLANDSLYVLMAHFKYHAVFVKAGDKVVAGQPLALAGNSGFSLEPHLHIQAHLNTHRGLPWYREPPMRMLFHGREYLLNDIIYTGGG